MNAFYYWLTLPAEQVTDVMHERMAFVPNRHMAMV